MQWLHTLRLIVLLAGLGLGDTLHPVSLNVHDPKQCALVLSMNNSNSIEPAKCITYQDVNDAFERAKHTLGYNASSISIATSPKINAQVAEVLLETTRKIAKSYLLNMSQVHKELPLIDTSRTTIASHCPKNLVTKECLHAGRYRTINGQCNNLQHPTWGASGTAFVRLLPKEYADGISEARVARDGSSLPNPRILSNIVHRSKTEKMDQNFTSMFMSWGQLLSHDITFVAQTLGSNFLEELCCDKPHNKRHANCLPMEIGPNDPFFSRYHIRCMEFVRSFAALADGCTLGPRDQINQLTSMIDASFIYGSTETASKKLRTFKNGLLLHNVTIKKSHGLKELLPARTDVPNQGCFRSEKIDLYCFEAGDKRLNENVLLTVLHTIWLREHNRVAKALYQLNPLWDDEKIFQESRHIVAAMVQHIAYNEYLPLVLGPDVMLKYNLSLLQQGYYNHYDPKINPGAFSAFLVGAFRFGHSQITSRLDRCNNHHEKVGARTLNLVIQQPYDLYNPGWMDEYILGMINQPSQKVDESISEEVIDHLFQNPRHSFGQDLAAINIQRGRDHGVPGYNKWRQLCGLTRVETFDELKDVFPRAIVEKYKLLYRHPDDIDLWSAGVSEKPLGSAIVGPTFSCLLGIQFRNLRLGDRFWYENYGWLSSFTEDQLTEIRKITQARIICDNTDEIETVQKYVMKLPNPVTNPHVHCKELPSMDFRKWTEQGF